MRSKLKFSALTIGFTVIIIAGVMRAGSDSEGGWPLEDQRSFKSVAALKEAFQKHHVSAEYYEGEVAGTKYVVVASFPYSGQNDFDVYCYRYNGVNWALNTLLFVADSKIPMTIDVTKEDDAIKIIHDGVTVATLRFGKGAHG